MSRLVAMIRMARLAILPGGVIAYGLGVAMAYHRLGAVHWRAAAMGLAVQVAINLAAHYADEYADVDTDALTRRTWFSGGSGVLPAGVVGREWALAAAWLCLGVGVALGLWWVATGALTPHVLWIGAIAVPLAWFYSMPPVALERRGLGELDNALAGGILMPLMGYTVQTGAPSLAVVAACLPVFTAVMVNLMAVHWADREADAAVGRRSLVVILDAPGTRILGEGSRPVYAALLVATYALPVALAGWVLPLEVVAAMLATLPVGLWGWRRFGRRHSPVPSSMVMVAVIVAAGVGWVVAA